MILGFVMAFLLCASEGQEGPMIAMAELILTYILTIQRIPQVSMFTYMTRSIDEARSTP